MDRPATCAARALLKAPLFVFLCFGAGGRQHACSAAATVKRKEKREGLFILYYT
jgi:hypothetical protein